MPGFWWQSEFILERCPYTLPPETLRDILAAEMRQSKKLKIDMAQFDRMGRGGPDHTLAFLEQIFHKTIMFDRQKRALDERKRQQKTKGALALTSFPEGKFRITGAPAAPGQGSAGTV